jgi:hypothetical protein
MGSRLNPVDVGLFLRALGLARHAQRIRSAPVPDVVASIASRGGGGGRQPTQSISAFGREKRNRPWTGMPG